MEAVALQRSEQHQTREMQQPFGSGHVLEPGRILVANIDGEGEIVIVEPLNRNRNHSKNGCDLRDGFAHN
jgi:hypothetical protein